MLKAIGIDKYYGRQKVLDSINLDLPKGGLIVVLGPSGAGKSTLVRTLSLLDPPNSGSIQLDTKTIEFPCRNALKRFRPWPKITAVFQQHFLWPHLTLRQNIMLPIRHQFDDSQEEKLTNLVKQFAIADVLDRYPNQASIGQRQRVAIIRALVLNPDYLLFDEITSALDVEQAGEILRFFVETWKKQFAALFVTHNLGFARGLLRASNTSRIVFLSDGRIQETGTAHIVDSPKSERFARFLEAAKRIN